MRPLLAERCLRCHGPDANARQAGLRLDLREEATRDHDGAVPIVPFDPARSEAWRRITSDDPEERMPPPAATKRPFSAAEREVLRRWIAEGANYEPHWSFVPPRRPALPAVNAASWPRNAIDHFVLASLENHGLRPSAEAPPGTLLRRVFLDLTGLPPTPEELATFAADPRPNAYEVWVDRLLNSEPYQSRYAERMATPWLDAARYADTIGIHTDAGRSIWPYRDWVLQAYRDNLPYDRFVEQQIAGDLLPNATLAQRIASGFHRCQIQTDEGGAIPSEYLVEYAVERVATTGSTFLGLTLGCARCHDHKFDPFTQKDFYSLFAFFNSIEEPGLYSQQPDAKRAFEPFLQVPSIDQQRALDALATEVAGVKKELARPSPEDDQRRSVWQDELTRRLGLAWADAKPIAARGKGCELALEADGSVFAHGKNPDQDEHEIRLATDAVGLRLVALEALADRRLPKGRVGRSPNGNAVLTDVQAIAVKKGDSSETQQIHFGWAWADVEQDSGDWVAQNAIDGSRQTGWAVDGHRKPGGRLLLLLADSPFGFAGGSEIVVTLRYETSHVQHALGRVRLSLASMSDAVTAELPLAQSAWHLVGPFPQAQGLSPYDAAFGPESDTALDPQRNFGAGNQYWRFAEGVRDGAVTPLPEGVHAIYLGRKVMAPSPRRVAWSLGSDDGIRFYVDGKEVLGRNVERTAAPDQDRVEVELGAGSHVLVAKIVNTGGKSGFYYRRLPRERELDGDLMLALAPAAARAEREARFEAAWRIAFSPPYAELSKRLADLERRQKTLDAEIPRTMVMKERDKPRDAFVLERGQYDKPDKKRPAPRAVPAWLGALPPDANRDRLALARWLLAEDNPLVARVAANRLWETMFGVGIVRTSEDFGHQGEWPSHEQLLDWLAVEYRASGWDTKALLRLIVTSATYRQSSLARADAQQRDPDHRLLAGVPRRRLGGEQLRDLALYVSGLLVERFGGPPVKPYQPQGLWEEVAMPQSNTRTYVRGQGEELWRRSLYTFWKRAAPPPALLTFDAPTRESCTIRRPSTSTPLQALVLWNDVQFVEAARVLAQRTLREKPADPIARMHLRVTGREPSALALRELDAVRMRFKARFAETPEDAKRLLAIGQAPLASELDVNELAALTLVASALLSLDATICRD